ncbi:SIMPL domain-containing protein [Maricaulaceae bacterium EIL42A08]|nr:SIMPL domain-containing protein [Maricaulaceae bacterium EIL42A08]
MIRSAALALTLFVLPAAPALAQEVEPRIAQLSLSATGEVTLVPDQATVSVGVVSRGDSAAEALRANAASMDGVFRELRRAGIEERDIQTSQLSVNPVYSRYDSSRGEQPRIIAYEARNTVTALVRDIDDVGPAVDAMFEAGANTLNGVTFSSSRYEDALDQARQQAVTNLNARRDLYAEAAGFDVVRLLNFSEGGASMPRPMPMMARAEFASDAGTQIAAGELTVTASVSAVWEIEG